MRKSHRWSDGNWLFQNTSIWVKIKQIKSWIFFLDWLVQYADITMGIKKWSMNATKEFTHVYYLLNNCILFKYFNYDLYCLQLRSTVKDFIQKAHGPHNSHEHRSKLFWYVWLPGILLIFQIHDSSVKGNIFLDNFCTGFLK